jgi:REP-associated tyrosine transposase
MPRRPRVFVEGGVFHVYNRLARGARILAQEDEIQRLVQLLRVARERDGLTILAWCVMANHYHLAVRSGPVPLARTIGYVQARFGQWHNRRARSSGPLWQSRYKAKLVEDERQLLQLIAYIHLNPIAAGVATSPDAYPWSGHREMVGKAPADLLDVDAALGLMGRTVRTARRAYLGVLGQLKETPWVGKRPGRLPWWGEEPDREVVMQVPLLDPLGRQVGRARAPLSAQAFFERACELSGIEPERIGAPRRDREASRERYLLAALAVERWRVGTKALAQLVGRRADVVTRWCRMGAELRQTDTAFRSRYDELDQRLAAAVGG